MTPYYPIAVPSYVFPGTIKENAHWLAGRVAEVGLCFFSQKDCLAYTQEDLPPTLAHLPLRWHMHLPMDLSWENGGAVAAHIALTLLDKIAFLRPHAVVLHPPIHAQAVALLHDFATAWYAKTHVTVLLENIAQAPLYSFPLAIFSKEQHATQNTFGICLDVGHMITFQQEKFLAHQALMECVQLIHWNAPGKGNAHAPLTDFSHAEYALAKHIATHIPSTTCHMLELFSWQHIVASYAVLQTILESCACHPLEN